MQNAQRVKKGKTSKLTRGKDYLWRQGKIEVSKGNKLRCVQGKAERGDIIEFFEQFFPSLLLGLT
jgi:hypothetical protein